MTMVWCALMGTWTLGLHCPPSPPLVQRMLADRVDRWEGAVRPAQHIITY